MTTLLEKAQQTRRKRKPKRIYTEEHFEVIKAWIKGEIERNQVDNALGFKPGRSFTCFTSLGLREMWRLGKLSFK